MHIIYILLGISVAINLIAAFVILNLLRQTESLEDLVITTVTNMKSYITAALQVMTKADINKSFESDDEVGAAFKDIKQAITDLDKKF